MKFYANCWVKLSDELPETVEAFSNAKATYSFIQHNLHFYQKIIVNYTEDDDSTNNEATYIRRYENPHNLKSDDAYRLNDDINRVTKLVTYPEYVLETTIPL